VTTDGADLDFLARRLADVQADMLHREKTDLHGHAWQAEALRRALADRRCLLISVAEHERLVEQAIATWKFNVDQVNRKNEFLETENRQLRAANVSAFKREVAQYIRDIAHSIPGKYRQEGALTIADKLDPQAQERTEGKAS
jgi:hypothetical protein